MSDAAILRSLAELTADAGGDARKTRHISSGFGILGEIGPWLATNRSSVRDVVVCDANTKSAAGDAVVGALRAGGREAELIILDPQEGETEVLCDDTTIEKLRSHLADDASVNAISVGAGTVNDCVKMATSQLSRPYVSVATAASMNGYTSAIAAVLSRGVKRTLPAQQPDAVFADIGVIAAAPAYLNAAGFGDLLSKPYSNADWLLSHLVRGVAFEERPARLLDDAYESLLEQAKKIGAGAPAGIGTLTRTILLSGFTMAIAGTSAPASGGEHLVSHYWDMEQHCQHEPLLGLHGTQVGVATRMSAMLFERLMALDLKEVNFEAASRRYADDAWIVDELANNHPRLTPTVREEVREQIAGKQRHGDAHRAELAEVRANWEEIRRRLHAVLKPAAKMTEALAAAGAADRPSAIGCDRVRAVATLRVCRHIRSRYVALDLMDDLGQLASWAAEVVDDVEA